MIAPAAPAPPAPAPPEARESAPPPPAPLKARDAVPAPVVSRSLQFRPTKVAPPHNLTRMVRVLPLTTKEVPLTRTESLTKEPLVAGATFFTWPLESNTYQPSGSVKTRVSPTWRVHLPMV